MYSKKVGIPFIIKIDTNPDKFGYASSFTLSYYDDTAKVNVGISTPFFEITKNITPASTTLLSAVTKGGYNITLTNITGFSTGSTIVINGNYYSISNLNITNNVATLKTKLVEDIQAGFAIDLSGKTGIYGVDVTINTVGTYTYYINNYNIGIDNTPVSIDITDTTIDDVSILLSTVDTNLVAVKAQVDLLNESAVNQLPAQLDTLSVDLKNVMTVLKDSDEITLTITGDETTILTTPTIITGTTSTTVAKIQYSNYDSIANLTTITVQDVVGVFQLGETITTGVNTTTTGTITTITKNGVNSVIEYVEQLGTILEPGGVIDTRLTNIENAIVANNTNVTNRVTGVETTLANIIDLLNLINARL